jgi:hypothetical protein
MARHLELEMQSELSVDYVKAVAGIFQASGYFGDRSVDQLATLIFVGDALGLKPANAVFDLEVKDGAIQYKAAEAFRKAADQVDGLKAEIDETVWCTFDRQGGGGRLCVTPESCRNTCQKENEAFRGPLPFQKTERPLDGPQAGKREPGQQGPAKRADLSDISPIDPGPGPVLENDDRFPVDIATPDPASAAAELEGSTELVDRRIAIINALTEDGKPSIEQQKGFYIYAGVNTNPYKWTIDEARKAHAALRLFLDRKPRTRKTKD